MLNELESMLAIQRPVSLISVRLYSALWVEEFSLFNLFDFSNQGFSLSLCVWTKLSLNSETCLLGLKM